MLPHVASSLRQSSLAETHEDVGQISNWILEEIELFYVYAFPLKSGGLMVHFPSYHEPNLNML